jgi:hypothetical protein
MVGSATTHTSAASSQRNRSLDRIFE